jgi:DNA polymerase-3 subunit epsilon
MQNKNHQKLLSKLLKNKTMSIGEFSNIIKNDNYIDELDTNIAIINANGLPIYIKNENIYLRTNETLLSSQDICFVDIETNGSKPENSQIIEIGAIKVRNGKIIDKFNSLVFNSHIPKSIEKITNITVELLKDAPKSNKVLTEFKLFLSDSIFVAHGLNFDYNFISYYLQKENLGQLLNQKICSLRFAKRMIKSQKYSISYFNEFFDINRENMHRAYDDAYVSFRLFQECINLVKVDIKYTNDLIKFIN